MKTIVVSPKPLERPDAWRDQPRIEIFYAWGRLVLVGEHIKTFLDWYNGIGTLSFLTLLSKTDDCSGHIRIIKAGVTVYLMLEADL